MSLIKATLLRQPTPDDEEKARKRIAEAEAWKLKQEEDIRLAVPREIENLRKEATERLSQAANLETLLKEFPNLRKHVGRWKKVAYYSKDVNTKVTRFDLRHNCGCCSDSPLEIWPYLETEHGKVFSDPSMFRVGEREPTYGGDIPSPGWDEEMRKADIPESIIGAVSMHFKQAAKAAKEAAVEIYGEDDNE